MTSAEKAERIMAIADDIKADRIEKLDIGKKTSVCDYFVICTGTSDTHVNAILERVIEKLKEDGKMTHSVRWGGAYDICERTSVEPDGNSWTMATSYCT